MIRIDEIWLASGPLDMRAGPDKALAQVVRYSVRSVPIAPLCSPIASAIG
jgi:hypothetical protein